MSGTREVYDSVLDAIHAVGHYSDGVPLKAQANTLGIPEGRYDDLCNATRKPRFPADLVAPQARASKNLAVVRTICRDAGGVFIPLPVGLGDSREVVSNLGAAIKESGDVALKIGAQLSNDGTLDKLEAKDSIDEIDQAISAFARLRELLQKKAEAK